MSGLPEGVMAWYDSRYTGLFAGMNRVALRPHDPDVVIWAGTVPSSLSRPQEVHTGGAGWDSDRAELACAGEAIERAFAYPLPDDGVVEASVADWPLDEPVVSPNRWVLFHPDQHAIRDFPFEPLTARTRCRHVCCRRAIGGEPMWVPEELVFLFGRPGCRQQLCPTLSTGLSCGRGGDPVLLRGLQEVIERDALMGAWWRRYPLEEWDENDVLALLPSWVPQRIRRPNLRYRFYLIGSPFSAHVSIVTVEGEDHEGWCFSAGSSCRETRSQSWKKSLLEAIHGRHYVRHLLSQPPDVGPPRDFAGHAVYYSRQREDLDATILCRAATGALTLSTSSTPVANAPGSPELLADLVERLGPDRPVLFRLLTPPGIAAEGLDWVVLKVVVPGLQPMHGDHLLPFLGGPLWAPRCLADWRSMPPHPFP